MLDSKNHDLYDFMQQLSTEMASEYKRIQKRATEDPGTAGDQGEENWAELLRDWLPRNYEVVTKGRIISKDGITTPQIDILVLSSSYPKKLLNKKLYLAGGVVAAFECKITLKAHDIVKSIENCEKIKSLYDNRIGTPYKELHSPIIYGILAHSHVWKSNTSTPEQNINNKLRETDLSVINHPRKQLDVLCVADLATWSSSVMTFLGPNQMKDWSNMVPKYGVNGSATTSYIVHSCSNKQQVEQFTPIGALISYVSQKIAWEDSSLRGLADYYRLANISGSGEGTMRKWSSSIYSDEIRSRIEAGQLSNGKTWDEWSVIFI